MKKNKLAAGVLVLAASMTVCGCDKVYELTDAEKAVIVNYSAHAVSKFNRKQSEGIKNVAVLEQQLEEQEEKEEKPAEAETQPSSAAGSASESQTEASRPQKEYVSLNQALKLGGVDAVYQNYERADRHQESDSYIVSANEGNELLILYINLKNSGTKAANCDILSKMPSFRLTINDKLSVSADTTILLNDLGTYQGRIQAGGTQRTVLIFQVKKGTVKKIKSMELDVGIDGTNSLVRLA